MYSTPMINKGTIFLQKNSDVCCTSLKQRGWEKFIDIKAKGYALCVNFIIKIYHELKIYSIVLS